jgi:hypothetical protein
VADGDNDDVALLQRDGGEPGTISLPAVKQVAGSDDFVFMLG